jgi:hypothetical protein
MGKDFHRRFVNVLTYQGSKRKELVMIACLSSVKVLKPSLTISRKYVKHIGYTLTQDKLATAYRRAQLLSERNSVLEGSLPYTDIWRLVMTLTKLKA